MMQYVPISCVIAERLSELCHALSEYIAMLLINIIYFIYNQYNILYIPQVNFPHKTSKDERLTFYTITRCYREANTVYRFP